MIKKLLITTILLVLIPTITLGQPTVKWGYRNISENSKCSPLSLEESYSEIVDDNCEWPLAANKAGDSCVAGKSCRFFDDKHEKQCLRFFDVSSWAGKTMVQNESLQPCSYLSTRQPKFTFNIDTNANVQQVKFRFVLGTAPDLTNPSNILIDYESPSYDVVIEGDSSRLWYSKDISFTVGQNLEAGATYNEGAPGDLLGSYGVDSNYYWYIKATEIQGGLADVMTSGHADADNNDETDCDLAFTIAKYFAANATNEYYTHVGAITYTTAEISFISPFSLEYYIQTDSVNTFNNPVSHPLTENATNTAGEPEKITITGLNFNSEVFYRIRYRDLAGVWRTGKTEFFDTAKIRGTTIKFGMTADMHKSDAHSFNNLVTKYGKFFNNLDIDFWITLGDFNLINDSESTEPEMYFYPEVTFFEKLNTSEVPVIRVMGNHENVNLWVANDNPLQKYNPMSWDGITNYIGQSWEDLFPIYDHGIGPLLDAANKPDHKTFFSFEWGDATFVIMDPYLYTPEMPKDCDSASYTFGEEQTAWFKNILKTSDATWMLVFMHQTGAAQEDPHWDMFDNDRCYGRGGVKSLVSTHESSALTDELLAEMSKRDNIVVFTGHDHVGAYNNFEGIYFISVPNIDQYNWPYIYLGYGPEEVVWDYEKEWNFRIASITCDSDPYNSFCDFTYDDECAGTNDNCSVNNVIEYMLIKYQTRNPHFINADKLNEGKMKLNSFDEVSKTISIGSPNPIGLMIKGEDMKGQIPNWEVGDRIRFLPTLDGLPVVEVSPTELTYTIYRENDFYLSTNDPLTESPNNIDTLYNNTPKNKINIKALDTDMDTIPDGADNCPNICNEQQLDADGDGEGDVCDFAPGCGGGGGGGLCGGSEPDCEIEC